MDTKRDIMEEIKNLPETQELNEHLLDNIMAQPALAKKKSDTIAVARPVSAVTAALLCMVLVGMFICIYFVTMGNMKNEQRYFDAVDVQNEIITDLDTFMNDNQLDFHYFNDVNSSAENNAYYTVEDHQLVFIKQNTFFFLTFDQVELGIVLTEDKFEDFERFEELQNSVLINNVNVEYSSIFSENNYNIKAKFAHEGETYFMEIISPEEEGKLEYYINTLLGN